jgi:ABC-type transport system substrate-binding protein
LHTPDDSTVVFTLSRPDATFLHVLAINFASVVPKEAVEAAAGDFGKKPVGSGTFVLKEWTVGQRLVFERNPDYFVKDMPHIDKFTVEVGQEPLVALLRLQKGEVDIAGDGVPPAKFLEIKNSPEGAEIIVDGAQLHTGYITLNTRVAVRQCEGPPGPQHGHQQGAHHPHPQRPRHRSQPAAAAADAGL